MNQPDPISPQAVGVEAAGVSLPSLAGPFKVGDERCKCWAHRRDPFHGGMGNETNGLVPPERTLSIARNAL